jgi:hypothetical protein
VSGGIALPEYRYPKGILDLRRDRYHFSIYLFAFYRFPDAAFCALDVVLKVGDFHQRISRHNKQFFTRFTDGR